MSEVTDTAQEALENAQKSRLNSAVAILVALSATFVALCNVKDGNVVQAMAQAQANQVDEWAFYQSKSTKQHLAETTAEQLTLQRALALNPSPQTLNLLDQAIQKYGVQAKKYEREKAEIKREAEGSAAEYNALNVHDDQFDMAEACLSVGIALMGVTALTQKRWLLGVASIFVSFGVAFGVAGFVGWNLHPDWLAHLLS